MKPVVQGNTAQLKENALLNRIQKAAHQSVLFIINVYILEEADSVKSDIFPM